MKKTWHPNGRQASLTAPHGTTYTFNWDIADRMQSIVIPGEGVIAYTEYQWHQPSRIEFPGGTVREDSYDGLQRHTGIRVTNASDQTLMDYAYTWDETGNITEKATEHGIYQYGYDPIDRLTEAEYPTFSAEEWTYDPLGNRITDASTGEQEWQYNDNNELLSSVDYTYEYDENGSLIAEYHPDGTLYRSHEYNAETRLSAVRDGQGELIAEYSYDPFGRRVKKTVYDPPGANPETTWYVYSDQGLMAELDENGNQLDFYLFPPDGLWSTDPILRRSEGSYFYYQTDHLGTPQQLIDRAGNLVHSREMRAFGEVAQSGMEDRWRFPGQLESQETGLYYNYFRDYEPNTGRYVQSDPIGTLGGMNIHSYAFLNPLVFRDPLGLSPCDDECDGTECCCKDVTSGEAGAAGAVRCCKGQPVICMNPNLCEDGAIRSNKACEIHTECTLRHEEQHRDFHTDCSGRSDGDPPNFKAGFDRDSAECDAFRQELNCLRRRELDCGSDVTCRRNVEEIRNNIYWRRQEHGCGSAI